MKIESLQELYIEELRDVYDAEQQLVKALPKMAKAATADSLRAALEEHLDVTESQVQRLDEIFEELGIKSKGGKCEAMKGLLEEAKELIEDDIDPEVLDVALIMAAQKVEHYEIASYGCLRTFAELLEREEQAETLQEILDEEKDADENLTEIAETSINVDAADEEEEEDDEAVPGRASGDEKKEKD
jgi:ferritin-like metal-binding protein YciE